MDMKTENQVDLEQELPRVFELLHEVHEEIAKTGIDSRLCHMVMLRASQINGCAFCIAYHLKDARQEGESQEKLDLLSAWQHVDLFTEGEKAALEYTEALTRLDRTDEHSRIRGVLLMHFNAKEVAGLTSIIGMINIWNRLQISTY
ncbi:Carboxymuconolactone decarboxylase family protein [Poriferisphaera corsica]|uniref:Carboxymuconolactone decarboxylase family protein n=1 Tax=Poriferisphaera corsica TaxID=2528020 RepID=A0A517YWH5_9BACT|nr:carboxymuconolactone decarboxylase family protein [Poriferisphaera corsica]QDU34559.1 Carboxymuconolactone decarboxylase family protein [Poriferisphaera corsica]